MPMRRNRLRDLESARRARFSFVGFIARTEHELRKSGVTSTEELRMGIIAAALNSKHKDSLSGLDIALYKKWLKKSQNGKA